MKLIKIPMQICILAAIFAAVSMRVQGQEQAPDNAIVPAIELSPTQLTQISEDMTAFIDEVIDVEDAIAAATSAEITEMQKYLQSIDVRWQAYTQIEQLDIASSPALMELLAQYKLVFITTNDSLTVQKARLDAEDTYARSLAFIIQCNAKYKDLNDKALRYSLVEQTASQLADVKAQEAMLFGQVTEHYKKAEEASQLSDEVKDKMPALEQEYIRIKALSEKIQAATYIPWIQRIKDYVLTFAGIAIILIFFNFVMMKLKALKQARDIARKYKDMLGTKDDYPTI